MDSTRDLDALGIRARQDQAPDLDVRAGVITRLSKGPEISKDPLTLWALVSGASAGLAAAFALPALLSFTDPLYGIWEIVTYVCP